MSKFYIASRASHGEMSKILGAPASRLNQKMADTLRNIAMKQGIAKTSKGQRLEFYAVDKAELDTLTAPIAATMNALKFDVDWRPLIIVDAEKMTAAGVKVNNKYPNSMTRQMHKQYLKELEAAVEDSVVKIAEDIKPQRVTHLNPGIKVGDWISHYEFRTRYPARVVRVTDKSYTYEVYDRMCEFNLNYLRSMFTEEELQQRGMTAWGDIYDGEICIPFKGNEELFYLQRKKTQRFSRRDITTLTEDQVKYSYRWYAD
jgi:hypothetical protein